MVRTLRPTDASENQWVGENAIHVLTGVIQDPDTAQTNKYGRAQNHNEFTVVEVTDPIPGPATGDAQVTLRIGTRSFVAGTELPRMTVQFFSDAALVGEIERHEVADAPTVNEYVVDLTGVTNWSTLQISIIDSGSTDAGLLGIFGLELLIPSEVPIAGETAGGGAGAGVGLALLLAEGASVGSAAGAGAAAGVGALAGASAGAAAESASMTGAGVLGGTTASHAACAAAALLVGALVGDAIGGSALAAVGAGTGGLLGSSPGQASTAALPRGAGPLVGQASGMSSSDYFEVAPMGLFEGLARINRERFHAQVAALLSLSVAYDNAAFAVPGTGVWVRMSSACDEARQIATGPGTANTYRKSGRVEAGVHAPLGAGDAAMLVVVDAVVAAFRGVALQGTTFGAPNVSQGERDGAHWRIDVRLPFRADFVVERIQGSALTALTRASASNVIRDRFKTLVEVPRALKVQHDAAPEISVAVDETWVRFSVAHGRAEVVEHVGSGLRYRTRGIAYAQILTPVESAEHQALSLGDAIADAFRAVSDRGVTFNTPLVRGTQREGPWWRVMVACPFQWDEVAS